MVGVTGYQVSPLALLPTTGTPVPILAPFAATFMNNAFLKVEGEWPMAEMPSTTPEAGALSRITLPLLQYTGVSGSTDNYTVRVGDKDVRVLTLAPRLTFPMIDLSAKKCAERLREAIAGLTEDETEFHDIAVDTLKRATTQARRLTIEQCVDERLLGIFNYFLANYHLLGIRYESPDIVFEQSLTKSSADASILNSALMLLGLAKAGRLILMEPATLNLFSREFDVALGYNLNGDTGSPLATVFSKEKNPDGTIILGSTRASDGGPIKSDAPILAVIGNEIEDEPKEVQMPNRRSRPASSMPISLDRD